MGKIDEKELINLVPAKLTEKTNEIAQQILEEDDINKVKDLTHLFNLQINKKNVIRILKLNHLIDNIEEQMLERFDKRPDEFSDQDLLSYLNVVQNALDKANKNLNLVDTTPAIQLNQINVLNVEEPKLSRESEKKVMEKVDILLKKLYNNVEENNIPIQEGEIVETTPTTKLIEENEEL